MIRALYTGATGMNGQQFLLDNVANNLANVNTNGFKRSMVDFADLMAFYQSGRDERDLKGRAWASCFVGSIFAKSRFLSSSWCRSIFLPPEPSASP